MRVEASREESLNVPALDLAAVKSRQRATWSSGDYSMIGTTIQLVGERLCEAVDLRAGRRVLDVAAGNGNASLAAARRFGTVVSTDYGPHLLARGRARAAAERLPIEFREADAEMLPFEDASFDYVLSVFGIMFTPDQARTASELLRVCRPGGKIGLANWTPEGFIGQMFKVVGRHAPPPSGLASPLKWGTESGLRELFGEKAADISTRSRTHKFRFRSAAHFVEFFGQFYGPVHRAFAALGETQRSEFEKDLVGLIESTNVSGDSTLIAPGEYLEVVITRR